LEYVDIDGVLIPVLGFGTVGIEGNDGLAAIRTALELGVRHLDTAQGFGNEDLVGLALKESGVPRDEVFLTTKCFRDRMHPNEIKTDFEASLRKLQTDYVDMLLLHWPSQTIPFSDSLGALVDLQRAGKTQLIGVSNFTSDQLREVLEDVGADVACNQIEYHCLLSQRHILDVASRYDVMVTGYCPIARGRVLDEPVICAIADDHGKTPAQVALRWLVQQPHVAAIPKSNREARVSENLDIFDFELTGEEMISLDTLSERRERLINHPWHPEWDTA
jgi:2,5-diketo-D-gluconate reductase B